MNTLSLNNLWTYLQGLSLTASNKKWLADHLYEAAKEETNAAKTIHASSTGSKLLTEEELPEAVQRLIGVAAPVTDEDINGLNDYYTHLAKKYA